MKDITNLLNDCFTCLKEDDFEDYVKKLKNEMEKGLKLTAEKADESSIKMLPSFLSTGCITTSCSPCLVMDAGGSNFRCAYAKIKNGKIEISNLEQWTMPGIKSEISSQELFFYIAEKASAYLGKSRNIGFCFSYPMEITKNIDGKLIRFTKEVKCDDAHGKLIGEQTLKAIGQYDDAKRSIVLLNDTVATLLGGAVGEQDDLNFIGLVYGTGFNVSVELPICLIEKLHFSGKRMVINEEAGGYNGFSQGFLDKRIDSLSADKGRQLTEKMVSGRYLGELLYQFAKVLQSEKLLNGSVKHLNYISTKQLSRLIETPNYLLNDDRDDNKLFRLAATLLVNRAAYIVAAVICATASLNESGNYGIVCEGTTFEKLPGFKQSFLDHLNKFMPSGSNCKLISGEMLTLKGTAYASFQKE